MCTSILHRSYIYLFFTDKGNKISVEEIQRSIFVLCLDEPVEGSGDRMSNIAGQMNHGGGSKFNSGNRWADKTLQVGQYPS